MNRLPDDVLQVIFGYLELEDAASVRCVSSFYLTQVRSFQWKIAACYCSDLSKWRVCFPNSTCVWHHSKSYEDVSAYLLPHLEFAHLMCCRVGGANFSNLQSLSLSYCMEVTGCIFEHLTSLVYLDVTGCEFFEGDALENLTNLETLIVDGCRQLEDAHFYSLEKLTHLDVSGCEFNGDLLMNKKLKMFIMKDAVMQSDIFHYLEGLEVLNAACGFLSPISMGVAAPTIRCLNLDYVDWRSFDVVELPVLETVSLRGTKFSSLTAFRNAKWVDLTDAWLDGVRDIHGSLRHLDVTKGTFQCPYFLTNIDYIDLFISYNCNFTNEVFRFCPLVRNWSVGCKMLSVLNEEDICSRMKTEFTESCHQDMCYC